MKNKYLILISIAVFIAAFVLGLTKTVDLSAKNAEQNTTQDKLIGIMVTKESLQLFDFESYFNDHAADIIKGNNYITDTAGYNNRIYAQLTETAAIDEATGETVYSKEYIFPDIQGWYLYCATVYDEQSSYVTNIAGDGLCDVKSSNHYKDNGEERTMEATLYTVHGSDLYTVYMNPIYQTENGEVYLTDGTGIGGTGGLTKTITETVTIKTDDEEQTYTGTFILHREEIDTPKSVTLTQMDKNNVLLQEDTYIAGQMPEAISPNAETAYVLVTTQSTDINGNMVEHRSLLQPSDAHLESFTVSKNGVCEKQYTEIHWSANNTMAA